MFEDHFGGKPLGVDVCCTNHAEADQDDMDNLLSRNHRAISELRPAATILKKFWPTLQ